MSYLKSPSSQIKPKLPSSQMSLDAWGSSYYFAIPFTDIDDEDSPWAITGKASTFEGIVWKLRNTLCKVRSTMGLILTIPPENLSYSRTKKNAKYLMIKRKNVPSFPFLYTYRFKNGNIPNPIYILIRGSSGAKKFSEGSDYSVVKMDGTCIPLYLHSPIIGEPRW